MCENNIDFIHFIICKRLNIVIPVAADSTFVEDFGFICDCGFWSEKDKAFHSYIGGSLDVY